MEYGTERLWDEFKPMCSDHPESTWSIKFVHQPVRVVKFFSWASQECQVCSSTSQECQACSEADLD